MSDNTSILRQLIELEELRQFKEMNSKKEEKKEEKPKKWFEKEIKTGALVKIFLLMTLLYPFVGLAYIQLWNLALRH